MPKLDNNFTNKIKAWLETPADERDIMDGATMLLQLNRNRIFFTNVSRRPEKYAAKIEYELRKFYKMRIDGMAIADVVRMQAAVLPKAAETICSIDAITPDDELGNAKVAKGRRADHESLPDRVKELFDGNDVLYQRIKLLYNECVAMTETGFPPCDIYEKLKLLDEADKKYRANLAEYDAYVATDFFTEDDALPSTEEGLDPVALARKLSAARKTISKYRKALDSLTDEASRDEAKAKIQSCVDVVLKLKGEFAVDTIHDLSALGISFKH